MDYKKTIKGRITRKKADVLLKELLKRVEIVNKQKHWPNIIKKVHVFGSYINTTKEKIGDLDVMIVTDRKKNWDVLDKKYIAEQRKIKKFKSFIDQLFCPSEDMLKFIKNRSRGISLCGDRLNDFLKLDPKFKYKTVYDKEN